jgi:Undecaprenyl-phosphate galactose phosphotransferase WbaP
MNETMLEGDDGAALDLTFTGVTGEGETSGRTQSFRYLRRFIWNAVALGGGDSIAIIFTLLLASTVQKVCLGEAMNPPCSWLIILLWWAVAIVMRLLPGWGIGSVEELRRVVLLLAGVYGGQAIVLVLTKQSGQISLTILPGVFITSLLLILLARIIVRGVLIARGVWGVPTVVYGDPGTTAMVIQSLRKQEAAGYIPIGVFSDEPDTWRTKVEGLPVFGPFGLATSKAPVAILATHGLTCRRTLELLDGPLSAYRHVIIQPDLFDVESLCVRVSDLGGMSGLEMPLNLLQPLARWSKHLLEFALVIITSPFWGPICLLLATIIWREDQSHPFFLQERIGKNGKPFHACKFRTMVPNAEETLRKRISEDPQLALEWETNFKLRDDPRVTRIGNILRRTSLDELPQLINVLRGEMSLVGPRPLPSYHHHKLTSRVRNLRERVRPGLTGLWQVSGRSQAGTVGMEKWDAFYVRNWSFWLDIVILARTVKVVLKRTGAY